MQKMKGSSRKKDKNQLELSCSAIFSSTRRGQEEEFTKKLSCYFVPYPAVIYQTHCIVLYDS